VLTRRHGRKQRIADVGFLLYLEMDRLAIGHLQRSFAERLGQRWLRKNMVKATGPKAQMGEGTYVGVRSACDVFRTRAIFERKDGLSDHLPSVGT
jgi:hypothetical protein